MKKLILSWHIHNDTGRKEKSLMMCSWLFINVTHKWNKNCIREKVVIIFKHNKLLHSKEFILLNQCMFTSSFNIS